LQTQAIAQELLRRQQQLLQGVDNALKILDAIFYGMCVNCRGVISIEWLEYQLNTSYLFGAQEKSAANSMCSFEKVQYLEQAILISI